MAGLVPADALPEAAQSFGLTAPYALTPEQELADRLLGGLDAFVTGLNGAAAFGAGLAQLFGAGAAWALRPS